MARYLLRRLVTLTITIVGIMVMTFFTSLVIPLDPLASLAGPQASPETVERLRTLYGFDQPLYVQFGRYVARLGRGDLGVSFQTSRPVLRDILTYFPATLELATFAILLGICVGIPLGVLSAVYRNRAIDQFCRLLSLVGVSTPVFWLGLVLMLVFYFKLGWLPEPGRLNIMLLEPTRITGVLLIDSAIARDWGVFADALKHLVLPAVSLAMGGMAQAARITRSSMTDNLNKDYILSAIGQGIPMRVVTLKFLMKPSLIPTVSVLGLDFASLIANAFLVELIFNWPGISRYGINVMLNKDLFAISAVIMVIGVIFVVVNILVDAIVAFLDPRIRLGMGRG